MPRAKRRITWRWVKIVMNVPPRVNGRRAVAPRNDQDLARPVLLPVPPQRSLVRHEHIIARQLTQSASFRTRDLAEPPRWCVSLLSRDLGLRQERNFDVCTARATAFGADRPIRRRSTNAEDCPGAAVQHCEAGRRRPQNAWR